jgi:DNA replication protein DnaC
MKSNQEFYAKAEEEIKRRRGINTEKLNLREREVETAIPEYREIRREMARTGQRLSEIILNGEDVPRRLERLQRENLSAQNAIGTLLAQHRYAPDYLAEIYTCGKCRDTGVYQNRRCSCFKEIVKRLAAEELNESAPIKLCSFDMFDLSLYPSRTDTDAGVNIRSKMERNFAFCKNYAENFLLPCDGILMLGKTGLGKTFLSLAIAKMVISKGYSVIYGSAPDLLRKIVKEDFSWDDENRTIELLKEADLLVFDDLGAEYDSKPNAPAFCDLINCRINKGLPTIISTNLTESELKKRYEDRVISRLLTMECLKFMGDDIRVARKFGINN